MEFSEERCLQLSSCVIAGPVALEYLIEMLKEEGPEFIEGPIVMYGVSGVAGVVVVRTNHRRPIKLNIIQLKN